MGPREHGPAFVPDDLLGIEKADAEQAIQHLAGEDGRMPHVRDLQTRHQFKGLGPIGARVPRDRCFGVALRRAAEVTQVCLRRMTQAVGS